MVNTLNVLRLASVAIGFTALAGSAFAQTAFQAAASVFSGEQDAKALLAISKASVVKDLNPFLKDPRDSASRVVAAFALAMKGVDIDANLARMVEPIKDAHDDKIEELSASRGLAENQVLLEDIPNAIYLIYKTRHYAPALKTLLTMPVDWPAAEYRDDCVMTQMRVDPVPVMAIASKDAMVYSTLWDIVDWNVGAIRDRKSFISKLRSTKWPNRSVKETALRLAHDLATPKNRPKESQISNLRSQI